MTELTAFLKEQTITGANKCMRTLMPNTWSTAHEPYSIPERKALGLKMVFDNMPLFIGEGELIVGTRTIFGARLDSAEGQSNENYPLFCYLPYINEEDIALFGSDQSYRNKTHYTPDFSILLQKGIGGILQEAKERSKDPNLTKCSQEFLESVRIVYTGMSNLILRYSDHAAQLAQNAADAADRERLLLISRICKKISTEKADTLHEAIQLLWFGQLGIIIESFQFNCYGRLDVILGEYLKDTDKDTAQQLIDCLMLKMYDQADVVDGYLGEYAAQLTVTLGGVLSNGENAVNDITMMFLHALDHIRLPEPLLNLRINSCNPPEFLDLAAQLAITGCNNLGFYNDDLFIDSMVKAGVPLEYARIYGFDLCQDITVPGIADFLHAPNVSMTYELMDFLNVHSDFSDFQELLDSYKAWIAKKLKDSMADFNRAQEHLYLYRDDKREQYFSDIKERQLPIDWGGCSPMAPIPFISALYHGALENAQDLIYGPYPLQDKGAIFSTPVEMINSLSAIKKVVYDTKQYTLSQVIEACRDNFSKEGQEVLRSILWNAPKWGNDDDYADSIAKEVLEASLKELSQYKTISGGHILGGIHQPHPVLIGKNLMATPEGRYAGTPVSVTLTPESGTMKNGPTAALKSATKIDYNLIQWNYCVMVNYYSSVFRGNSGKDIFKKLLTGYFEQGGLQHQPNILDVQELKDAQIHPEKYQDLIVRLWGVSAHFVKLPKELQDEMIARFS